MLICCLEQGHKSNCQPDQIWNTDIWGNLLLRSGHSAFTSKGVSGGAVEGAQKVHPQVSQGSWLCQELLWRSNYRDRGNIGSIMCLEYLLKEMEGCSEAPRCCHYHIRGVQGAAGQHQGQCGRGGGGGGPGEESQLCCPQHCVEPGGWPEVPLWWPTHEGNCQSGRWEGGGGEEFIEMVMINL